MKKLLRGDICAVTNQWGQVKDLVIVSEDGVPSRLSKNELWEKIKGLVGRNVEIQGSCYFLPNRDRVINAQKVEVLGLDKKILLERIS